MSTPIRFVFICSLFIFPNPLFAKSKIHNIWKSINLGGSFQGGLGQSSMNNSGKKYNYWEAGGKATLGLRFNLKSKGAISLYPTGVLSYDYFSNKDSSTDTAERLGYGAELRLLIYKIYFSGGYQWYALNEYPTKFSGDGWHAGIGYVSRGKGSKKLFAWMIGVEFKEITYGKNKTSGATVNVKHEDIQLLIGFNF